MGDKDLYRAEIVAVGSELLDFSREETNSIFLAEKLRGLGIRVMRKWVVGDRPEDVEGALSGALKSRSNVVLFSGGLGPTNDDLTRETVAAALNRPLSPDPLVLEDLEHKYAQFRVKMTDNNLRQALVPQGATVLRNPKGTAPGLLLEEGSALIFLLPGPPRELKPMVETQVLAQIQERLGVTPSPTRHLKVASMGESALDARIEDVYRRAEDVETTILSSVGIIDICFHWIGGDDQARAERRLDRLVDSVKQILGKHVYAERDIPLEAAVGDQLASRGRTLATAESCTGGLISKMLTDIPGSSGYYRGGVVSYSDDLKTGQLGVNETTLQRYGAVSSQTALQMAEGVRLACRSDFGLSVTGIAGPDGGSAEKPVGLIYLGLAWEGGSRVRELRLPGDRLSIRLRTARLALDLLRRQIT